MSEFNLCDTQRNNLIAAAIGLQQCTKTAANLVPLADGRVIAIGTPADVARLLEIPAAGSASPAAAGLTDERIAQVWNEMPDQPGGFAKSFGAIQFARAIEREVLAHAGVGTRRVTEEMVERAIDAFNEFPCPMNGSVSRTGNRDHMRATLEAVFLAAPSSDDVRNAVPAAEPEAKECWSADEENFNATSLSQLLDENEHLKPGDTVWVGEAVRPDPKRLFNTDWLLENMGEAAYDIAGEHADDYPDVSNEDVKELEALVADWIKRTCPPNFWTVENVKPYVLSADDFTHPAAAQSVGDAGGAA